MSEFKELIQRFEKIRAYVWDFYIYGFKSRNDYQEKSLRTYDNERRRLESWFSDYTHSEQNGHKKSVFITMASSKMAVNPLFQIWKSKTFTAKDITLHFFLLELFFHGGSYGVEALTDQLQVKFGILEDPQTIRRKLSAYEREGILDKRKEGRQYLFSLNKDFQEQYPELFPSLFETVCFFQGNAPFGFVGSTIMDWLNLNNLHFRFRNDYLIHTLEDEILLPLLQAIKEQRCLNLTIKSSKNGRIRTVTATPLKILISAQTGRRYLCGHQKSNNRLASFRLDNIQDVKLLDADPAFAEYQKDFSSHAPFIWGVSFGEKRHTESVCLHICVNEESESYILDRLEREGRHGTLKRLKPGLYEYTYSCWDAAEMLPWIKSFTGRIASFSCSNPEVEKRLFQDLHLMEQLYGYNEGDF